MSSHAVPPTITTDSESHEVVIGNSVTLSCSVSGFHLPNIVWSQEGQNISSSSRLTVTQSVVNESFLTSHLEISSTEQADTGNYTCSADNSAGIDTSYFYLQILGIIMQRVIIITLIASLT